MAVKQHDFLTYGVADGDAPFRPEWFTEETVRGREILLEMEVAAAASAEAAAREQQQARVKQLPDDKRGWETHAASAATLRASLALARCVMCSSFCHALSLLYSTVCFHIIGNLETMHD